MMIRTAGGPGLVSPIDFHERKTPRFSRTTWIAVAIVAAGHVGLGVALYYQRFEMAPPVLTDTPRTTIIEMVRPEPKPLPVEPTKPAQAPNTAVNTLPTAPLTSDTVAVVDGDKPAEGTVIAIADNSPTPVENAPAAVPTPQPPTVITHPSWVRQPSAEQLMRAYPDRALQAGVGGSAMLNCLVQPNGRVTDCNLVRETPGYGFGRAAQSLSRHFQIAPRTVNGAAEGARVNIAIRFNAPAE